MKTAELLCNGSVLVSHVEITSGFSSRTKGLLGRDCLGEGCGMYFEACNAVHTFFMRFSLDLVFFNRSMVVTRIVRDIRPFRVVFGGMKATSVLELESGWLSPDALRRGDAVELVTPLP